MWIKSRMGLINTDHVSLFYLQKFDGGETAAVAFTWASAPPDAEVNFLTGTLPFDKVQAAMAKLEATLISTAAPPQANNAAPSDKIVPTPDKPVPDKPAPAKVASQVEVTPAEARKRCLALFNEIETSLQPDWRKYLAETYGSGEIEKIKPEFLAGVYKELHEALKTADEAKKLGAQPKEVADPK